ncbi:hypothetical protein [Ruegeria sp. Ofav3-42]|uniref:hypothetical protein n=1 Tax=Ruegeria sp. Ofav3-42 TaxID=2917759 RepID=UPI001EF4BB27|nr:hypothetical protein [Ruegeria sp. Ofav3-42]MCG7522239.1 hypothetical protein [Ruegeria sp. Ofav3-42]
MDLFDLMVSPPQIEPVDTYGPVIQGDVDEVLTLPNKKQPLGAPTARIELHKHTDGRWMWSTSAELECRGFGYRVGPKWGKFAASRDDALHWARKELCEKLSREDGHKVRTVLTWANSLT